MIPLFPYAVSYGFMLLALPHPFGVNEAEDAACCLTQILGLICIRLPVSWENFAEITHFRGKFLFLISFLLKQFFNCQKYQNGSSLLQKHFWAPAHPRDFGCHWSQLPIVTQITTHFKQLIWGGFLKILIIKSKWLNSLHEHNTSSWAACVIGLWLLGNPWIELNMHSATGCRRHPSPWMLPQLPLKWH